LLKEWDVSNEELGAEYLKGLESENPEVRIRAIRQIGALGYKEAETPLRQRLAKVSRGGPEYMELNTALRGIKSTEDLGKVYVEELNSEDREIRIKAIQQLGNLNYTAAIQPLKNRLVKVFGKISYLFPKVQDSDGRKAYKFKLTLLSGSSNWGAGRLNFEAYLAIREFIAITQALKYLKRSSPSGFARSASSPITDLPIVVPAKLIGALSEDGRPTLSVTAGEVADISFGNFWNQITGFAAEHPDITTLGALAAAMAGIGGIYYFWSRHTVSGNTYRLQTGRLENRRAAFEWLVRKLGRQEAYYLFIRLLYYTDSPIVALWALGELGDQTAIAHIIVIMGGSSWDLFGSNRSLDLFEAAEEALVKLNASAEQRIHYCPVIS
jgi:hypothetical protein